MTPEGWQNPVAVEAGQQQRAVDPRKLLPGRPDLLRPRLEFQRALLKSGQSRYSPIMVTLDGVIYDGHHAVRAAAEEDHPVDILVVREKLRARADSILDLPIKEVP